MMVTVEMADQEILIDCPSDENVNIKATLAKIARDVQAGYDCDEILDVNGNSVGYWNIC
jgi:hypothetical protein